MDNLDKILRSQDVLYIFGYGSLTWKPDFESDRQIVGYIKGYERRFWQGSTFHRGTPKKPGRVLTLTKADKGEVWGLVFEVKGREKVAKALDYLQLREQSLGGYDASIVPVFPKPGSEQTEIMHSIIYHALPVNPLYLGSAPMDKLAEDIATSKGKCGHNIEYLFRLADFMREHAPGVEDPHLFELERSVRHKIGLTSNTILPWKTLLECPSFRTLVKPTVIENGKRSRSPSPTPKDILVYAS